VSPSFLECSEAAVKKRGEISVKGVSPYMKVPKELAQTIIRRKISRENEEDYER